MHTPHTFEKRLSSGIPVLFADLPGHAAALYWWVSVGSEKEGKGEEGFAHFLEHMLFKDAAAKETGAESTGELARIIEGLGGDINAYTSLERTVYHVTCSEKHFETVVDAFARMATPTAFLKSDFEREREVILEEYRRGEDNPGRALYESVFERVFGPHPYGRPVIGFPKTLKAAKVGQLEAFYRREYRPSQMGFVVVGPMDAARVQKIERSLERAVGAKVWKQPSKQAASPLIVRAPKLNPDPVFKTFDVKSPSMVLAFPAPGFLDADTVGIELLVGALGQGDLSRLYQGLFLERGLVTDVGAGVFNTRDHGMAYVHASTESSEKLREVLKGIDETIERLSVDGVTEAEHERWIVNAESEKAYAVQTVDGWASRLGFMRFVAQDLDFDRKSLQMLKGIDPGQMGGLAQRIFGAERAWVNLLPKSENLADLKVKLGAHPTQMSLALPGSSDQKVAAKAGRTHEKPVLHRLGSGLRVVFQARPASAVFSMHLSCLGGVRLESLPGSSHLLGELWDKGTDSLTHHQLLKEFEGRAASLGGFSGRNSVGLEVTGLVKDFAALSTVIASVVSQPSLPDKELLDVKRVTFDHLKSLEDHSGQLCSKLFLEALYERHPYGRYALGTAESVQACQRKDLEALFKKWVRPERMVISVSGGLSEGEILAWVENLDAELARRSSRSDGKEGPALRDEALAGPRWVERRMGREQTHCIVGTLGTTLADPDRFALRILNNVLGGMGGRLFVELREKRSLAYSVHGNLMEGLERGYYSIYIASAPAKAEEAKTGIRRVLEAIAKRPPTQAEVKRAQEYSLGRRAMDLQSDASIAAHSGLQVLYRNAVTDEDEIRSLQRVTPRQVQQAAERIAAQPWVTAEVG